MAKAIDMSVSAGLGGAAPYRCAGALAAAVVVGNSASARERFNVQGCSSISVRAKCSAVTSDPVIQVVAQLANVGDNDATTGDVATGLTAETTLTTSEVLHEYTLKGERYVDVVVTSDSGDSATISYVDVYVKPV